MRRRAFIGLLGGAALAWPLTARAQQPGKYRTIGFLGAATPSAASQWVAALVERLRELGWIEGRTVAIEYRWAEGRNERLAEIAAEFVRLNVDVIVTWGTASVLAAKQATSVIPIAPARRRVIRSAPPWSRAWRGPAGMSPDRQTKRPISLASGSNSHASLSPGYDTWRFWPTSVAPLGYCRWARLRQRRARSGSRSLGWKLCDHRISRLHWRPSKDGRRLFT
jgi:hypothetical protein